MVPLAKLMVESSACVEFAVLLALHLLDFVNEKVEIVNAWGIVGK
jgi:hypothetical protein